MATLSGGSLKDEYKLLQLHFHWGADDSMGSEHTINNRRFPLEMHLVHQAKRIPADKPEGLAVAGFLFQLTDQDNPNIDAIVKAIFDVKKAGQKTNLKDKKFNVRFTCIFLT